MFASIVNRLEEGIIALLLAAMTLLTFSQVVARYVFNTGAVWALEATEFLFAWMIFLGISYGVKVGGHIGVDAAVKLFPRRGQQVIGLLGAAACIAYSAIVVYGSWIYVSKLHMIGSRRRRFPFRAGFPSRSCRSGSACWAIAFSKCSSASCAHTDGHRARGRGQGSDEDRSRPSGGAAVTTAFLFVSLFVLMLAGVPIAVSLGLSSILTIMLFANDSLASLSLKLFETAGHYTLLAIPFFILGGSFMTTGGVARRLVRFANDVVGHFRGGLAIASVLACMLFAAVSGSSPATVVAVGSIAIGGMVKMGYRKEFAAGIICNAGTLGILVPPSIVMVVYAAATDTSVGRLFLAGSCPARCSP